MSLEGMAIRRNISVVNIAGAARQAVSRPEAGFHTGKPNKTRAGLMRTGPGFLLDQRWVKTGVLRSVLLPLDELMPAETPVFYPGGGQNLAYITFGLFVRK